MKHSRKSGAITVEVAIGITLAVIVVLVALGLFSENLATMISNSGIANMFKNSNKTTYSSFGRDYTDSQVNVQLIGEQGLSMLRNIANNKAIEQIDKYMSGADTSVTNVNSITYLAIAINSIVGSPDICVYMKKDSDKKCNQDNIGGYSYRVNLNGGSITLNKEGGGIPSKYPTVGADFLGGAQGVRITSSSGTPSGASNSIVPMTGNYSPVGISTALIYKYIKELSAFADDSNTVYDPVILIKAINAGTAPSTTMTSEQVKSILLDLLTGSDGLADNMQYAHDKCACGDHWYCDGDGNYPVHPTMGTKCGAFLDGYSTSFVDDGEVETAQNYASAFATIISGDTSDNVINIINNLLNSPDLPAFIDVLQQDHINDSCTKFTKALATFNNPPNNLGINIPQCIPYGYDTSYCKSSGICSP